MTNRKEVYIMTPASQLKPELITLTQYEALPEDKRVEVFEGTVYNMAGPSQIHQALSMQLSNIIFNYIKKQKRAMQCIHCPLRCQAVRHPAYNCSTGHHGCL